MGKPASMRKIAAGLAIVASSATSACTAAEKPPEGTADFATFVVPALPESAHPTLIDFGGKVHVVGYEVSPVGSVRPSEAVTMKLYWERVGALQPWSSGNEAEGEPAADATGWGLFTHLEDDYGRQLRNFDREGAFRGKVSGAKAGLALLELGKIYVDEQTLEMPKADELSPRVSLVVGVWNRDMRLPIVSGSTNGHDAALVAGFSTGVERKRVAMKAPKP